MGALALFATAASIWAVAIAAGESWHVETRCWHANHIAAADDPRSFFLIGRIDNTGEACIERWNEGAEKPLWSRTYEPSETIGNSGFGPALLADNGDLIVSGWYTTDDDCNAGVVAQISAKDGNVVWREDRKLSDATSCGASTSVVGFLPGREMIVALDHFQGDSHTILAWLDPASGKEISAARMELMVTSAVLSPDAKTLFTLPPGTYGRLFAWDAANVTTGTLKQKYEFGQILVNMKSVLPGGAASLAGGCVWVSEESGGLGTTLLGCDTRIPVWENVSSMATSLGESAKIVVSADIANNDVGDMSKWIVGLHGQDSATGQTLWYTELPLPANFPDGLEFSADGSALYVICSSWSDFNEHVFRVEATTGRVEWHSALKGIGGMSGPLLVPPTDGSGRDLVVTFGLNELWAVKQ